MPSVLFIPPSRVPLPTRGNNEGANKVVAALHALFDGFWMNEQSFQKLTASPLASVNLVTDVELPGVRGRARSWSGPVLTLGRASDARKFKVGDVVRVATVPGGDGLDELRAGSVRLTAVSAGEGTLTASADWASAIPGIAKGDWLCIARDGRAEYGERSLISVEHGIKGTTWGATGFLIVNARDGIPSVRRIPFSPLAGQAAKRELDQRFVQLASVYACTVDILFF